MTLYKDIAKCATSLIDDNFDSKMTIKAKSKAACGVGITSKSTISDSLAVTGALEGKYSVKNTGFAIDKLALDSKGTLTCETSLSPNMINGLTIGFNRTYGKEIENDLSFEFQQDQFHADTNFNYAGGADLNINSSILAKFNEISVGGKLDSLVNIKKEGEDKTNYCSGWGMGASYCNGKLGLFATTEELKKYSVSGTYKCSDQFKCATLLTCEPEKDKQTAKWSTALAGAYACNKTNTFKAKVTKTNDALQLNAGHSVKLQKGTDISAGIGYKFGTLGEKEKKPWTYGFTVTLA